MFGALEVKFFSFNKKEVKSKCHDFNIFVYFFVRWAFYFLGFPRSKFKTNEWSPPFHSVLPGCQPLLAVKLWTNPSAFTSQGCVKFWREFLERFTEHAHILTWKWREVSEPLRGRALTITHPKSLPDESPSSRIPRRASSITVVDLDRLFNLSLRF